MKVKNKKSPQELLWIEDLLPLDQYQRKPMFGGFAYYYNSKLILLIFEDAKTTSYKNIHLDYPIWHGCLFPSERDKHAIILKNFPILTQHPVLPKWLYLPTVTENFEEELSQIIKNVIKNSDIWGIIPKNKAAQQKRRSKANKQNSQSKKIDMSKPQMFRDDFSGFDINKIKNITDLKNLGPSSEKLLKSVGINSGQQLLKLGWKKVFLKLVKKNPKNLHLILAKALIGAITNQEWFRINPTTEQEAKNLIHKLRLKNKTKSNNKK